MENRKSLIFCNDWIDYTMDMSLEEKGLFLQTILRYHSGEELGEMGPIKFIWTRVKKQIDENNENYDKVSRRNQKNGKSGGRPPNPNKPKITQSVIYKTTGSQDNIDNTIIMFSNEDTEKSAVIEYGNPEINNLLSVLKNSVGCTDFKDSVKMQRRYTKHLLNLGKKIGEEGFSSRLKEILEDEFKAKNCNKLAYLYGEMKSFIHSPVIEIKGKQRVFGE